MSITVQPAVTRPANYRLPIFWPSQLKLYLDCPERYYHKYVARTRAMEPFSRDLARGIALHAVLADCFSEFQRSRDFPSNVRKRVEGQLRQQAYPAELSSVCSEDADDVTAYVLWVLSEFDSAAEVLGVEQTLSYYYRATQGSSPCLFRAKVDLVVAHADGTLEHIDFKAGKVRSDPIQEVMSRIVLASEYCERFPVIRTSTVFVAERKRISAVLERDECRETWQTIKRAIAEVQSQPVWKPSPSPFCGTCPYFNNGCSAGLAGTGADELADWLDGENDQPGDSRPLKLASPLIYRPLRLPQCDSQM